MCGEVIVLVFDYRSTYKIILYVLREVKSKKKKEEREWRKVILPFGSLQICSIYMFYPQLWKNAILYHQWHQCMFVRVLAAIVETVCRSGDIWKLGGYCRWNKPHTHHTKSLLLVFSCTWKPSNAVLWRWDRKDCCVICSVQAPAFYPRNSRVPLCGAWREITGNMFYQNCCEYLRG